MSDEAAKPKFLETLSRLKNVEDRSSTNWMVFVKNQIDLAIKNGNVDPKTKRPFFEAQVRLLGENLGVGMVSPSSWIGPDDEEQREPDMTHDLFALRAMNPNPKKQGEVIVTETFFDIRDVIAMTLLRARANDKPQSSILMG